LDLSDIDIRLNRRHCYHVMPIIFKFSGEIPDMPPYDFPAILFNDSFDE
jgi:hypothetical protein